MNTIIIYKNNVINNIRRIIVLVLLICFQVYGQSNVRLMGSVTDSDDGSPISEATIQIENTRFSASTDNDGLFYIENISVGVYTISVSSLGYLTYKMENVVIEENIPTRILIHLESEPIIGDSVIVVGKRSQIDLNTTYHTIIISSDEIDQYKSIGLPQLLQQVPGVQVETSGGSGGQAFIKIHGSRSNQVLVLLDGQRLNNPQTGEIDLNIISLENIDRVEIVPQANSAEYGGGSFGGIIKFFSKGLIRRGFTKVQGGFGSFKTAEGEISFGRYIKNVSLIMNYFQNYSLQNFTYNYEGESIKRKNSWYRNQKLFGKLDANLIEHQFKFLYNLHKGVRGLPSSYFNEYLSYNANVKEIFQTTQLNYQYLRSPSSMVEGLLAYNYLNQIYDNEQAPRKLMYKTKQINQTMEGKLTGTAFYQNFLILNGGLSYYKEILDQQNLLYPEGSIGKKSRDIGAVFGGITTKIDNIIPTINKLRLRTSLRFEKNFNKKSYFMPFIGVSINPSILTDVNLMVNYAIGTRYPDFNSLFWKGDARARGNPDLLPEENKAWNFAVGYSTEKAYLPQIHWKYFVEDISNLIFWHRRFDGIWEPRNEEKVSKSGWDFLLKENIYKNFFQIQAGYSHVVALNKKDDPILYNKKLIFVPEHTVNLSLLTNIKNISTRVIYRYVSERETVISNSNGTQILSYSIWDVFLGYNFLIKMVNSKINLVIKNLTGEDYQLIFGYPMPGREIHLGITLTINQS